MLPLCDVLHITVNDLLSGAKISQTDYQKKAEENMMNLMKENEENMEKETKSEEENEAKKNDFLDLDEEVKDEPEYVTREINLDDLYDGAINNTVVIDPITKDEVLMTKDRRPNYAIIGIIIAILALLILYWVNNKSDLGRTTKNVAPKTTTTTRENMIDNTKGTLTCSYESKSDAELQTVTYTANYEKNTVGKSEFNFVAQSLTDSESAVVSDLKTQYENFFINNAAVQGNRVTFDKNSKGFTFNVETNYKKQGFDGLILADNQTILFVKPQTNDTIDSLKNAYTDKGFKCSITNNEE